VVKATQTQFDNSVIVGKSEDQVWSDLIGFFTSRNIQIQTIERDSGVIYAERASFDDTLASCDMNSMLAPGTSLATLNVFVRPLSPTQTQVTVNTDFRKTGRYGANEIPLNCYSTGLLEADILRAAGGQVVFTPAPAG